MGNELQLVTNMIISIFFASDYIQNRHMTQFQLMRCEEVCWVPLGKLFFPERMKCCRRKGPFLPSTFLPAGFVIVWGFERNSSSIDLEPWQLWATEPTAVHFQTSYMRKYFLKTLVFKPISSLCYLQPKHSWLNSCFSFCFHFYPSYQHSPDGNEFKPCLWDSKWKVI